MTRRSRTARRLAAAVVGVVALVGLTVASAAGLEVRSTALAAGTASVTSCQPAGTPIQVGLDSELTGATYTARRVVLRDVAAACAGQRLVLTVTDASGAALEQVTVASVTAGTMTVDITDRAAAGIGGVAVVITR